MRTFILGAACALVVLSGSVMAADESESHSTKPTIEDQCRSMGVQHGMKDEKMDAWMKKCLEIVGNMKRDAHSKSGVQGHESPHGNGMEGHDAPHGGGMDDHESPHGGMDKE